MYIRTFKGSDDSLDSAIEQAEQAAQVLLDCLSAPELISIQSQTIVDRWNSDGAQQHWCFHIITVTFE